MTESLAVPQPAPLPAAIEQALIAGDLSSLSTEHRVLYYQAKCKSLGLNPLTQPFGYLRLNGKLVLYALKDAKEQLRKMHGISLEVLEQWRQDTLYFVRVRANTPDGRFDEDMGFAELGNLKGEALGNAMLKAMTKAKSRVTLSICGLGGVDETEIESIPEAVIEDQESPAVQKAMDRFHAKDAEVKASQEPTSPFVPAEKTPGGIPSTATASPSTPPPEAGDSAVERKPRQARKSEAKIPSTELLKAVSHHLNRLCGTSKQDAQDLSRSIWGKAIGNWLDVKELPEEEIRRGLATLEKMQPDNPPAVPPDASEGASSSQEAVSASAEEDVPTFPPSDGNTQEGPQEAQGGTIVNHEHNGLTQQGKVASNEQQAEKNLCGEYELGTNGICQRERYHTGAHYFAPPRPEERGIKLPDEPMMVNDAVSRNDARLLEAWARAHGQANTFERLTKMLIRDSTGCPLMSGQRWKQIRNAVDIELSLQEEVKA